MSSLHAIMGSALSQESRTASRICGLRVVQISTLGIFAKLFLAEHLRRLREAGADVSLVCTDDENARQAALACGIRHIPVTLRQRPAPVSDFLCVIRLWRLFRRLRPDMVHAHMPKPGLVGLLAGWLAGVPVRIYHNHGLPMMSVRGTRYWLLYAIEWVTHRLATHALFCGDSTLTVAIETGVALAAKSRVPGKGTIAGVDVERFKPDTVGRMRAEQRKAWGVDDETVVVGFVGRLVAHKGIETLVAAWRQLEPVVRGRARLVLAGGKAHTQAKMQQLVEAAIADGIGVMDAGWVEDMVACYSGMDMLVLPSSHEGFPYSLLEAQSMALPVVATRATGNLDAVEDEVTGLLVPMKDPTALARALSRLICSEEDRRRLGEGGRRRILKHFSQDEVLRSMMAFYEEAAGSVRA